MLYPLNPRPLPQSIPPGWNLNERCDYHQNLGHKTDNCVALRHAVQDLIDTKKISDPSVPNVARNPLPNHHVHAIREDVDLPDPVTLIRPISERRNEEVWSPKNK